MPGDTNINFHNLNHIKQKQTSMSHFTVMVIGKDPEGQLAKFEETTNGGKWDWYVLGGRWSGLIKLLPGTQGVYGQSGVGNNAVGIDRAKLGDIENIDEISTFAIVKDGQWYERGEMGWWGMVYDVKNPDEWDQEVNKLMEGLPDETLISIYDCHI